MDVLDPLTCTSDQWLAFGVRKQWVTVTGEIWHRHGRPKTITSNPEDTDEHFPASIDFMNTPPTEDTLDAYTVTADMTANERDDMARNYNVEIIGATNMKRVLARIQDEDETRSASSNEPMRTPPKKKLFVKSKGQSTEQKEIVAVAPHDHWLDANGNRQYVGNTKVLIGKNAEGWYRFVRVEDKNLL